MDANSISIFVLNGDEHEPDINYTNTNMDIKYDKINFVEYYFTLYFINPSQAHEIFNFPFSKTSNSLSTHFSTLVDPLNHATFLLDPIIFCATNFRSKS